MRGTRTVSHSPVGRWFAIAAFVGGVILGASPALADDECAGNNTFDEPVLQVVNGHRRYVFRTRRICGERQTPYAFAVTGRRELGYTPMPPQRSDTTQIVEAVRHAPF